MSAGTCLSSSGDRIRRFLLLFSRYVLSLSHSFPHLVSCSFRVESVQNYTHLFTIARVRDVRGCTCSCFTCANDEARGIRREPQRTNTTSVFVSAFWQLMRQSLYADRKTRWGRWRVKVTSSDPSKIAYTCSAPKQGYASKQELVQTWPGTTTKSSGQTHQK